VALVIVGVISLLVGLPLWLCAPQLDARYERRRGERPDPGHAVGGTVLTVAGAALIIVGVVVAVA
jgi:hypothetical protein